MAPESDFRGQGVDAGARDDARPADTAHESNGSRGAPWILPTLLHVRQRQQIVSRRQRSRVR